MMPFLVRRDGVRWATFATRSEAEAYARSLWERDGGGGRVTVTETLAGAIDRIVIDYPEDAAP